MEVIMNNNTTKKKQPKLTEKRVREIAREEIIKWHRETFVPLSKRF